MWLPAPSWPTSLGPLAHRNYSRSKSPTSPVPSPQSRRAILPDSTNTITISRPIVISIIHIIATPFDIFIVLTSHDSFLGEFYRIWSWNGLKTCIASSISSQSTEQNYQIISSLSRMKKSPLFLEPKVSSRSWIDVCFLSSLLAEKCLRHGWCDVRQFLPRKKSPGNLRRKSNGLSLWHPILACSSARALHRPPVPCSEGFVWH